MTVPTGTGWSLVGASEWADNLWIVYGRTDTPFAGDNSLYEYTHTHLDLDVFMYSASRVRYYYSTNNVPTF